LSPELQICQFGGTVHMMCATMPERRTAATVIDALCLTQDLQL